MRFNLSEDYDDFTYEIDDFDDGTEVEKGKMFVEGGNEYTWARYITSQRMDFDDWAVWEAYNEDTKQNQYFVVEQDTGFIDWGPCDTIKEAVDFLESKYDEYLDDDEMEESLNEDTNTVSNANVLYGKTQLELENNVKKAGYTIKGSEKDPSNPDSVTYKLVDPKGKETLVTSTKETQGLNAGYTKVQIVSSYNTSRGSSVITEDVDDEQTLPGPKEGPEFGLSDLLIGAINDEWETIRKYNSIAVTARAEGYEDMANIIDNITTEENVHIGQLQAVLKTISPNANAIENGEEEGQEQLNDNIIKEQE